MSDVRPVLPLPLDLNDPAVENEVADAIRRLGGGEYVPLSQRYPWRFSEPTAGRQETTIIDAVLVALRGSADVHEAERIPHLVAPLRALADALERSTIDAGLDPRIARIREELTGLRGTVLEPVPREVAMTLERIAEIVGFGGEE